MNQSESAKAPLKERQRQGFRPEGNASMNITFLWATGDHPVFQHFYAVTEAYYSQLVGGAENRRAFVPYNASAGIPDVLLAFCGERAAGCVGLKRYSETDAEVKRLWVEPAFRGQHIATALMDRAEEKAAALGYSRIILQTRLLQADAVALYTGRGFRQIPNYPPYDKLEGAVCYAKMLSTDSFVHPALPDE